MRIRPLILDDQARAQIRAVRLYAEAHPFEPRAKWAALAPGETIAEDPGHSCVIRVGYWCVFSVELTPLGRVRHLSVALKHGHGKVANEFAVASLQSEFGFTGSFPEDVAVWIGQDGGVPAINVVQPWPISPPNIIVTE